MTTHSNTRSACILFNPFSGRGKAHEIALKAKLALETQGWQIPACMATDYAGHAERVLVPQWAGKTDMIVVIGGDGTLREVVSGLLRSKQSTRIGFVPMGNANVMAREFGIPLEPEAAIGLLSSPRVLEPDAGMFTAADGKSVYFLAMIELGLGAQIVNLVDQLRNGKLKRLYQVWGDIVYGIAGLLALKAPPKGRGARLLVDGKEKSAGAHNIVISCVKTYAKGWSMTPSARFDDGQLDYVVNNSSNALLYIRHVLAAAKRLALTHETVSYGRGKAFQLFCDDKQPLQADGDTLPKMNQVEVKIVPKAYRIVVPDK